MREVKRSLRLAVVYTPSGALTRTQCFRGTQNRESPVYEWIRIRGQASPPQQTPPSLQMDLLLGWQGEKF